VPANPAIATELAQKVVIRLDLLNEGSFHTLRINRSMVDGVIGHPTARTYHVRTGLRPRRSVPEGLCGSGRNPDDWQLPQRFLGGSEPDYQVLVNDWKASS